MRVRGIDLYVETLGGGPPLVLLHGGPGLSHEIFRPELDRAAEFAKVVYFDQRGCGGSARAGSLSAAEYAADLDALTRELGFESYTLLGHSWGAYLALHYALNYKRGPEKLILVSPATPYPESEEHLRRLYELFTPAMRREVQRITMSALPPDEKATHRMNVILPIFFHNLVALEQFRRRGIRLAAAVVDAMAHADALPDLRPELGGLRIPVTIVVGKQDRRTPPAYGEEIESLLYDSKLLLLDECGHFPFLERPRAFMRILREEMALA